MGDGIFNVDGEKWRIQRKVASTLVTTNNFRNLFVPIFAKNLKYLDEAIDSSISNNETLNILSLMGKYALDSFSESSCGKAPAQNVEHKGISSFEKAFEEAQAIVDQRFRIPFWWIYEIFTGTSKKMRNALRILDDFVITIIRERKNEIVNKQIVEHNDLLNKFVMLTKIDNKKLTNRELRDIMLSLLVAGRDTTSHALTWLIFFLNKDERGPALIEKILEELYYYCPDGVVTYDIAKDKLYVFQAVFYETLRLFPSVPKNMKTCMKDTILPNGKILVKKGDLISISPFASARLAVNWGPNATKFLPERWLHNVDDILKVDIAELANSGECPRILSTKDPRFIAFNSGPRRCIGAEFALIEATMVATHIFKKYTIKLSPNDFAYDWVPDEYYLLCNKNKEPIYIESLTMPKKHGLLLNFQYRIPKKYEKNVNNALVV